MKTEDVTNTLEMALTASGCDQARVVHKPRLLSNNEPNYVSGELAKWLDEQEWRMFVARPIILRPRARSSAGIKLEEPHPVGELLPAWRRLLQPPPLSREPQKPHTGRCLLRARPNHPDEKMRIKRDTIKNRRSQHQRKAAQFKPYRRDRTPTKQRRKLSQCI